MTGKAKATLIAFLIALVLVPLAAWGITVATAGIKGQGDAHIVKSSASNWTKAQARFEELYADIEATDRKITVAAEAKAADPTDKTAADTYLGTVNVCIGLVGDYNAEARKYLSEEFRSADLPARIDTRNPATDCKE